MEYDIDNEMFRIAFELVNQSSRNIFLTGKAGTGKTTFLKYIRENCSKQIAVVAPTGVAAINAGGVTIHSFFQLPFSPFIPETQQIPNLQEEVTSRHSLLSRLRFNGEKRKVLQQLELLIVDEISMVRCDTLDAMDAVLRFIRQRPTDLFGGVQLLFIGDMFQLAPVIKEQDWRYLSPFYKSQYFFDSWCLKELPPVYIEFTKIYRQSDERFIKVLNQVRTNTLDTEGISVLESRFHPEPTSQGSGYIILTTHNDKARAINTDQLDLLSSRTFSYQAEIQDDFAESAHPADSVLQLKVGAQVMFIKNDLDKEKRYFNGKIGVVSELTKDKIFVQFKDGMEIEVKKEKWDNIRYTMNNTSRLLEEEVLGSFTQFPLRLAWAITIHKSQGLTFEKAIIDAGAAFAPGQVYVALSRCTSLSGLILKSKIKAGNIFSDPRIVHFSARCASRDELQQELEVSRIRFRQQIILRLFDFVEIGTACLEMRTYLTDNIQSFNVETGSWMDEIIGLVQVAQKTAMKFRNQLLGLFAGNPGLEDDELLQSRIIAGSKHFSEALHQLLLLVVKSPAVTDSTLQAKEFNDNLRELFGLLTLKKYLLDAQSGGFKLVDFLEQKRRFVLPKLIFNAYAAGKDLRPKADSAHPALHQQLRRLRDAICSKKNLPIYLVAGSKTIDEMTEYLPQTLEELEKINGFGPAKLASYGQQFLDIILAYSAAHHLTSSIRDKGAAIARKPRTKSSSDKPDTKFQSFLLFKQGKTVQEIALLRTLTVPTIEGHLVHYIESGGIDVRELVSLDKLLLIEPLMDEFREAKLSFIKEKLGSAVSFGDLRFFSAARKFTVNKDSIN